MIVHNETRKSVYTLCGKSEHRMLRDLITDYLNLQVENAAIHKRLDNAVELKAKIGDYVYMPWFYDDEYGIATLKIVSIGTFKDEIIYHTDFESDNIDFGAIYNYGTFYDYDFGVKVFTNHEEAVAKMKELKGEE